MIVRNTHIFFALLFLLPVAVLGQGTYYNSISSTNASFVTDLKSRVRSPYTHVNYSQFDETNVAMFASRDSSNGQKVVTCVYSGQNYAYSGTFAWTTFSREHTFCHSWMPSNPADSPERDEYSDQHHLFPTNQNNANGVRSNHPLGNVVSASSTYLNGKLGTNSSGQTVYEPRSEHKGDAARAILYMCVRYDGIDGLVWNFNNLNSNILPGQPQPEAPQDLQTLIDWHKQDPPRKREVDRNDYIQGIQGNRNPFTDHPEYVNYINFNDLTKVSPAYAAEPSNQPTAASVGSITGSSFTVSWTSAVAGSQSPSGYLVEIYNSNDYFIPIDGSTYTNDADLADSKGVVNVPAGTNSYSFSGLSSTTTYYIRIYSYNGSGASINYKIDGTIQAVTGTTTSGGGQTYATEPSNNATGMSVSGLTSSSLQVNWTKAAAGAQAPGGYLLLASTSSEISVPADGTIYSDDTALADNTATVNIDSSLASYSFSSLNEATTYYFKLFPYNGSGSLRNYKTDGTTANTSATTIAAEPSNHPVGYNTNTVTSTSITVRWPDATGTIVPTGYLLAAVATASFTDPTDGTVYSEDTVLSDGSAVVNVAYGVQQYTFSSLNSSTLYTFRLYPYRGNGALRNYKVSGSPATIQYSTLAPSVVSGPSVVVNEYFNGGSGVSEWVELLVCRDALDMRGMKIYDFSSTSGGRQNALNPTTFANVSAWQSVAKGTFIVIFTSGTGAPSEDLIFTDNKVVISNGNISYFTGASPGFVIGAAGDGIDIVEPSGTHIHMLSHGTPAGDLLAVSQPKANVSGSSSSGAVVRFAGVSSMDDFSDNTNAEHNASATLGSANDATESSFIAAGLPVELLSFTGVVQNGQVILRWRTATELENYGFEIERITVKGTRLDVEQWKRIGFVEGNGTSNAPHEYSFVDRTLQGSSIYRLKQIDRDGSFEYSPEVSVTVQNVPGLYSLGQNYPNPFNPSTTIRFTLAAPEYVTLMIHNALGQTVETAAEGMLSAGVHDVLFDASSLSSGTYFYTLTAGKFRATKSFVLMK